MKKMIVVFSVIALSVSLILSGAVAEASSIGLAEKSIRLDATAEEYEAWAGTAFSTIGEWSEGSRRLDNCPLLVEPVALLFNEFRSSSSTLEKGEYNAYWHSDALKVAFDERMLGIKVTVELGNEGEKKELDVSDQVNWQGGILIIYFPEEYSFKDISALRINYDNNNWLNREFSDYTHAWFHLAYDISDGKVICKSLDTEMDDGRYIVNWVMRWDSESNDAGLHGIFYDLAVDAEFGLSFDLMTGECLYY